MNDSSSKSGSRPDVAGASVSAGQLRQAIMQHVIEQVRSGAWPVGHRIATDMALAKQFETSVTNANQAVRWLQEQGIVQRHRRRGTFVVKMPDSGMQAMAQQRKARTVHVLLPDTSRPMSMHWNRATLEQIESVLNEKQLQVEYCTLPDKCSPRQLADFVRSLPAGQSHAMVILLGLTGSDRGEVSPEHLSLEPYVEALLGYSGRICWLNRAGRSLNTWPHDAVCFSPFNEGMAVGQYLVENAVSDVMLVSHDHANWSRLRTQGVQMMLRSSPLTVCCQCVPLKNPDQNLQRDYTAIVRKIARSKKRFTLVMPNDHFARMFLEIAREQGLSCPEAFNLISFDNDERYQTANMTTVAPPASHLGQVIGKLLNDSRQPSNAMIHMTLRSVIIERSTCDFSPASARPAGKNKPAR